MTRIMLVDDEYSVLSSLRRCIHLMPRNTFDGEVLVETFDRPQVALARARECEFDLVISDWRMPEMNGLTFLAELIALQPNIERLVLSAHSEFRAEVKEITRLKIFHFISKPWNNDILCALLRLALDHRRQLLANQPPTRQQRKIEGRQSELELSRLALERRPTKRFEGEFKFRNRSALAS